MQYVGKTIQELRSRMNQHRSQGRAFQRDSTSKRSCVHLAPHFWGPDSCGEQNFQVQPIEQVAEGQPESLASRERFWIKELRTLYPYGLNKSLDNEEREHVESLFNPLVRKRCKRGRRHVKSRSKFNPSSFFSSIAEGIWKSFKDAVSKMRQALNGMKKKCLRTLNKWLQNEQEALMDKQRIVYLIMCDLLNTRLFDRNPQPKKRTKPELVWSIPFLNSGLNFLGLESLLRRQEVVDTLPLCEVKCPTVVYTYTRPIRNLVLNYGKTLETINDNDWKINGVDENCECVHSSYCHKELKHVVTGDLNIIKDEQLRRILGYGPSYRLPRKINWRDILACLTRSIDTMIVKWSELSTLSVSAFSEWKKKTLDIVAERINRLQRRVLPEAQCLNERELKTKLQAIHGKYVLTQADKAAGNIIIVCKSFYKQQIVQELKKSGSAYKEIASSVRDVIQKCVSHLQQENIKIPDNEKHLAVLYWTAKMHKNPPSQRFIAASHRCVTKSLSVILTKCLRIIQEQHRRICQREKQTSGYNYMWIADNSRPVLSLINRVNFQENAKRLDTFDFRTLYTNIPHKELRAAMAWVIQKAYQSAGSRFLSVYSKEAKWTNNPRQGTFAVSAERLKRLLNLLLENVWVVCGQKVFQQKIGIPMGTDCAPFLANLFLYYYEQKWLHSMTNGGEKEEGKKEEDKRIARIFSNTARYIDDLITVNNSYFAVYAKDIYPKSLELGKENESPFEASFLDLNIKVHRNGSKGYFVTNLYDKRDAFGFKIVNFPYLHANIHFRRTHGVLIGQLIRFATTCSYYIHFRRNVVCLVKRLLEQGFCDRILRKKCHVFYKKYGNLIRKYRVPLYDFVSACFN